MHQGSSKGGGTREKEPARRTADSPSHPPASNPGSFCKRETKEGRGVPSRLPLRRGAHRRVKGVRLWRRKVGRTRTVSADKACVRQSQRRRGRQNGRRAADGVREA